MAPDRNGLNPMASTPSGDESLCHGQSQQLARPGTSSVDQEDPSAREIVSADSLGKSQADLHEHIKMVAALVEILEASSLSELDYQHPDLSLRLSRASSLAPIQSSMMASPTLAPITVATTTVCERPTPAPTQTPLPLMGTLVKSPLVGTAYLAPQPDHPPFVRVGDRVKTGQTLLIIEAMKVMNTITAPKDGVVSEIFAANGRPVEYDETLMRIE
jgi:acetyl-CoA carboxylase biotin carboxyl carrier protein